jgi:hypothetical protein
VTPGGPSGLVTTQRFPVFRGNDGAVDFVWARAVRTASRCLSHLEAKGGTFGGDGSARWATNSGVGGSAVQGRAPRLSAL